MGFDPMVPANWKGMGIKLREHQVPERETTFIGYVFITNIIIREGGL